MAQAQIDAYFGNCLYYQDINEYLRIKLCKKMGEEVTVTFIKLKEGQCFTIPLHTYKAMLQVADITLLASDFLRGLIGVSTAED